MTRIAPINVILLLVLKGTLLYVLFSCAPGPTKTSEPEWISLFNGVNLDGWTPKFSGYSVGENYKNTFNVSDSILHVNYAAYDSFRNEFGHLFFQTPFSSYRLRLEYRFNGGPTPGAPEWAYRNNGIMIHCQSPQSMLLDQDFPMSAEVQLLGGDSTHNPRPTGNLCTPGYHVYINDTLTTEHCINSTSKTYMGDTWVSLEVVVLPDGNFYHIVEGDTVMHYAHPVVGGGFIPDGYPLAEGTEVKEGYIALQAESHNTDFRNIRLQKISQ